MDNPKRQATAMKIQLMKLKAKAIGMATIPAVKRIYFLIILPKSLNKPSKPVFVSKNWSVGKVIDSASTICNVVNKNNEFNEPKLRLFKTNGHQISSDVSSIISDLIENNFIVDGETLILEYVDSTEDISNYILSDCSCYSAYDLKINFIN